MNWLTSFVRPRIQRLVNQKNIPDNLWQKCPFCSTMLYHKDLEKNLYVCNHCGHHLPLTPEKRFETLFDQGEYKTIDLPLPQTDPLKFKDLKKYTDRLKEHKKKTGHEDVIQIGYGTIGKKPIVIAAFDFNFMGGSMGTAVGEAIIAAAELAILQESALLVIPASGGARMQEGILSLMQMARTTIAISRLKEKGLPYLVLLTNPTAGGVTASFAMLGDIHIAEPNALICFAGPRVIEQTIREKLPEGFQKAEYLLEHGMVDMVTPRKELPETLGRILSLLKNNGSSKTSLEMNREEILSKYVRSLYTKPQKKTKSFPPPRK